jgi:hypothetical protein
LTLAPSRWALKGTGRASGATGYFGSSIQWPIFLGRARECQKGREVMG